MATERDGLLAKKKELKAEEETVHSQMKAKTAASNGGQARRRRPSISDEDRETRLKRLGLTPEKIEEIDRLKQEAKAKAAGRNRPSALKGTG